MIFTWIVPFSLLAEMIGKSMFGLTWAFASMTKCIEFFAILFYLFYARFCERVPAGNGRVYKCLLKHKMEVEMTSECRYQLLRREKMGWKDFK